MDDIRRVSRQAQENRIEAILRERGLPALEKDTTHRTETHETYKTDGTYNTFLKRFFLVFFTLVLLGAVALGGYIVFKNYTTPKPATAQDVVTEVGKLVELPQGENPTVATISDLKPLAGQDFFKDAQIGDKVLIYATSSKAILYRPSTGKIINVASYTH